MKNRLDTEILPENEQEMLEDQLQVVLRKWVDRVEETGAMAKGVWLVDFDNGAGFFCWKHGEEDLLFEHSYDEGFMGRRSINLDETEGRRNNT